MEKFKNSIIVASYVLLMVMFFWGGYAFGSYRREPVGVVAATSAPKEEAVSVSNIQEQGEKTIYKVVVEDGVLCLYEITGGEKKKIADEEISENIFPRDDMERLKNGIMTDNLGDAQSLFENFVS